MHLSEASNRHEGNSTDEVIKQEHSQEQIQRFPTWVSTLEPVLTQNNFKLFACVDV